jgi:F-type H+-transporting ATPase subunit b
MRRIRFAVLLFAIFLTSSLVFAQVHPANPKQQATEKSAQSADKSQDEAQGKQAGSQETVGSELAKTSREAAGEEEENAEFKHSPSVQFIARLTGLSLKSAYWLSIFLNFAILAVLVVVISKSKLPAMFRTRTDEIQRGMREARKASEDANRRLADIETRLQRLDSDVATMRAAAEAEAANEEERIRQAAELEKKKIVEGAESEIAAAAKLARRELKTYAADLAVSLAEKRIHVDGDTDRALVGNFVEQLKDSGTPGKDGH